MADSFQDSSDSSIPLRAAIGIGWAGSPAGRVNVAKASVSFDRHTVLLPDERSLFVMLLPTHGQSGTVRVASGGW